MNIIDLFLLIGILAIENNFSCLDSIFLQISIIKEREDGECIQDNMKIIGSDAFSSLLLW